MSVSAPPRVSVILPAYRSEATVAGCLHALRRQSYADFEVILVDSGPEGRAAVIARRDFPEVHCHHSPRRLLPDAARNIGVTLARGELLAFSAPDVFAEPTWLGQLVAAHDATGAVVVGALVCDGRGFFEVGVHLCKFSKLLPAGDRRPIDIVPTGNMLCARSTFEAVGRFRDDVVQADVAWGRRAVALGHALTFVPGAVAAHHQRDTWRGFLGERACRGLELGRLRWDWEKGHPWRLTCLVAATVLPVRLLRVCGLVTRDCARAGRLHDLARTFPVVLAGHTASLLGEAAAYSLALARCLLRRSARPVAASHC